MHVDMYAGDLTNALSLSGGTLAVGCWGHVAFAVDAAGAAKLFVDGTEVASGSFQGTFLRYQCDPVFSVISVHQSHLSPVLAVSVELIMCIGPLARITHAAGRLRHGARQNSRRR